MPDTDVIGQSNKGPSFVLLCVHRPSFSNHSRNSLFLGNFIEVALYISMIFMGLKYFTLFEQKATVLSGQVEA